MLLNLKELKAAIDTAKPLFTELQKLYCEIPVTDCHCENPGICCAFIPEMTLIEALQWLWVVQNKEAAERNRIVRHLVRFYLSNPLRHLGCPFLENGCCGIYEFRTFACRAYGLWSQEMGVKRTNQSRDAKTALLAMWRQYGVSLPPDKVSFEIDYCRNVKNVGKDISDEQLINILQNIYSFDRNMAELQSIFENEYHSDFSYLITSLVLGQKKALLHKFAVIKELVKSNTDARLNSILSNVLPQDLCL